MFSRRFSVSLLVRACAPALLERGVEYEAQISAFVVNAAFCEYVNVPRRMRMENNARECQLNINMA